MFISGKVLTFVSQLQIKLKQKYKTTTMMKKYNYREQLIEDIHNYIHENRVLVKECKPVKVTAENKYEIYEQLYDELWIADEVTGNGSGSYFGNRWEAEEALCHNIDLLVEAMEEFGCKASDFKGAEWGDATIRCYLLSECLNEVLDFLMRAA